MNDNVDYNVDCGYKPISALFPTQQTGITGQLPPGYTTSNIFDVPPEWSSQPTFDDDYVSDNFLQPPKSHLDQPHLQQVCFFM